MKPWEETWTAKLEPTFSENDLPLWEVVNTEGELVADCATSEASARLLAQAPAMARLLLDFRYIEMSNERGGYEERCGSCLNHEHLPPDARGYVYVKDHKPQHAPDCKLVAVLRAAGVLETPSGEADDLYINSTGKDY